MGVEPSCTARLPTKPLRCRTRTGARGPAGRCLKATPSLTEPGLASRSQESLVEIGVAKNTTVVFPRR